jgi:hypothetical protein
MTTHAAQMTSQYCDSVAAARSAAGELDARVAVDRARGELTLL